MSSRAIQQADWGRERYLLEKFGNQLFDRPGRNCAKAMKGSRLMTQVSMHLANRRRNESPNAQAHL